MIQNMGLTLYQNLENLMTSGKALSKEKIKIDYNIEIKDLKSIFEVNERDVSTNLRERMEKTPNDNIVKDFDLRLCIFWKKIYLILRIPSTTKQMICKELFEFLSYLVCLLKRNEFSKFAELLIILEFCFYFELILDKFEQIDYNNQESIEIMLPLITSKLSIIEKLIKVCFPKFDNFIKNTNEINDDFLDNLFKLPVKQDFVDESTYSTLIFDDEKEQIYECVENCTSVEVKEGILKLLSMENLDETIPYLYLKTLQQLKRMYDMCKNSNSQGKDISTTQKIAVCRMQHSKEVIQLKMMQICCFLSKEEISAITNVQFECINSSWDLLYFQLCKYKIIYCFDIKCLVGICCQLLEYNSCKNKESKLSTESRAELIQKIWDNGTSKYISSQYEESQISESNTSTVELSSISNATTKTTPENSCEPSESSSKANDNSNQSEEQKEDNEQSTELNTVFCECNPKFIRISVDKGAICFKSIVNLIISEVILVPKDAKTKDEYYICKVSKFELKSILKKDIKEQNLEDIESSKNEESNRINCEQASKFAINNSDITTKKIKSVIFEVNSVDKNNKIRIVMRYILPVSRMINTVCWE